MKFRGEVRKEIFQVALGLCKRNLGVYIDVFIAVDEQKSCGMFDLSK